MIKFENTEIVGWEAAIRGMRNPMNSWEKSDSGLCEDFQCDFLDGISGHLSDSRPICPLKNADECELTGDYIIGPNDLDLMKRLCNAETDHRKFMRMITVYVDITAPLYWWKEFDTYKVGTVANSCSTMHKIADKEFTLEDFSCEHLLNLDDPGAGFDYSCVVRNPENKNQLMNGECVAASFECLKLTIDVLNTYRYRYLKTNNKKYWWQMIQLLPSSYNQKRTVMMNYEVLANIYKSRKSHKLDEWCEHKVELVGDCPANMYPYPLRKYSGFCDWIKTLPYSELITGRDNNEGDLS